MTEGKISPQSLYDHLEVYKKQQHLKARLW